MSSSPNPFADDPLPAGVVRLQSAADPLDPYAAPPSAVEYRPPTDPGVGLWQDGNYLVMHLDAAFPPRCLATNEPGEIRRKQTLTWSYPIDWSSRRLSLEFFISPREQAHMRKTRRMGAVIASACGLLFAIALYVPAWITLPESVREWAFLVYLGLIVGAVFSLGKVWNPGKTLQFVRAKKSYLWLGGVSRAFLNSLPVWPGFGS